MSDGGWPSNSPEPASHDRDRPPQGVALASILDVDPQSGFETVEQRGRERSIDHRRDRGSGGYPLDQLFEEVAFVAYHFGWAHDDVLALPHWERQRWCEEISAINERMNERRE